MKGYIVGYFDEWCNDRNDMIIGYYTTWNKALEITKMLESENITYHGGRQQVYLVEIEVNKTNFITTPIVNWIDNYTNYRVYTENGKTIIRGNNGYEFETDLPELNPETIPIACQQKKPVVVEILTTQDPDTEWSNVQRRKSRQQKPNRPKRLSRQLRED